MRVGQSCLQGKDHGVACQPARPCTLRRRRSPATDGQFGTILKVNGKTCRLLMEDGTKSGNVPHGSLAVARSTAPLPASTPGRLPLPPDPAAGTTLTPTSVAELPQSPVPSRTKKVRALAIGASQERTAKADKMADDAEVDMRATVEAVRFVPRRMAPAFRGGKGLPDVIDDVVAVKQFLEDSSAVEEITRFVGRDDTNSLTRQAFLSKLDKLLQEDSDVFILYYAGHGTSGHPDIPDCAPGALCMKSDGYISLDDLINAWVGFGTYHRRGKRFVVVADSCHSGALVEQLRATHEDRRRKRLPNLNMAVQSACGANELSMGGVFTRPFLAEQRGGGGGGDGFNWEGCVPHVAACGSCRSYYKEACGGCEWLHKRCGFPRHVDDVQHPNYFSTFGGTCVEVDGFKLSFYRRRDSTERAHRPASSEVREQAAAEDVGVSRSLASQFDRTGGGAAEEEDGVDDPGPSGELRVCTGRHDRQQERTPQN